MFKINQAYRVCKGASSTGIKWRYKGKVEEWKEVAEEFEEYGTRLGYVGVRVTDIESGKVIYEKVLV